MSKYIEADKLATDISEFQNEFDPVKDREQYIILDYTLDRIDDAPSADVAEVKHEYWKGFTRSRFYGIDEWGEPIYRDGVVYRCSNPKCNKGTVIKAPYCQWCGARMDAKEPRYG